MKRTEVEENSVNAPTNSQVWICFDIFFNIYAHFAPLRSQALDLCLSMSAENITVADMFENTAYNPAL